ncbi:MAG TPA: pyruvate carboxylase, partial [Chthonomonadales bacterium]|nr:pyruvate carboxylase [Chthonomonadales bacterium]
VVFIGPPPSVLDVMGDKTAARAMAEELGIPTVPGTAGPVSSAEEAVVWAQKAGYPVLLKASFGGGGRGMRMAGNQQQLKEQFTVAAREAEAAFGRSEIFLERYLANPRHIEVQILADSFGATVHLFERDCSVQRRHQKVVEIAPAVTLAPDTRQALLNAAVSLAKSVGYVNAGTVEFLLDDQGGWYFIEMNPRVQVEHTVTELVTGVDIVKSQIAVAEGKPLMHPSIGIPDQLAVQSRGYAVQCRITTEDPSNNFIPDYGRISHYRSPGGFGIRLDGGTAYSGAVITPFYDSMIVKLTAWSLSFPDACNKLARALSEFRIRGVKTNIPFLENVVKHPAFREGRCTTSFVESTPELFQFKKRADRGTRLLEFIGEIIVNGNPQAPQGPPPASRELIDPNTAWKSARLEVPIAARMRHPFGSLPEAEPPAKGARALLHELGAERFSQWVLNQKRLLLTDTTLRDAHQSLLATRMRTFDMLPAAAAISRDMPQLFSMEVWGGATFDVAMRFLQEDPWERLKELRERVPAILFQMLLRGSNAVGYANYPDNVVREFVRVAARDGIDLFRIFDSLNYVPAMIPAIEAAREAGAIAEAAICYSGDLFDPARPKFHLDYYLKLARELESAGATMLAIKDMAGLCRPYAAAALVKALKSELGIPI